MPPMFPFSDDTGDPFGFRGRAGDNQFGNFGTGMPTGVTPTGPPNTSLFGTPAVAPSGNAGKPGGIKDLGGGFAKVDPLFPQFTQDFFNFLQGQIGKGASPFPGDVNAPRDPLLQALSDFYAGTGTGPEGFSTVKKMSDTGLPIDVMPQWEAMVAAQKRNIEQGAANLREQFAFRGNLASTPFGTAATDYQNQAVLQQNALLADLTRQSGEAARQRQLSAGQFLAGGGAEVAKYLQTLSQEDIDRMLAEFIRTRPEYSPYLNMLFAGATTSPGIVTKNYGIGGTGALLQGIGTAAGAAADIWKTIKPPPAPAPTNPFFP